jgi:FlaA1/EpsC-like NDP-sugar epimerase
MVSAKTLFGTLRAAAPLAGGDMVVTAMAWTVALLLRYDGDVPSHAWSAHLRFLPVVLVATLGAHAAARLYSGVLRFASVLEARQVLLAQAAVLVVLFPVVWLVDRPVPLSVPIMATVLTCGVAGALRFWSRLLRWRLVASSGAEGERLIVIGAGQAGVALVRDVQRNHTARVVGFLDDDPRLRHRRVLGVKVHGCLDELPKLVELTGATRAVFAITRAEPSLVRRTVNLCGDLGIGLSIVPPASELVGPQVSLQDVRDIEIADLLGRAQVDTDLAVVRELITGRRVLITGGGGSIGSELARQVSACAPARLTLLDHDETHLFDAAAPLPATVRQRLADVRDVRSLRQVFEQEKPEIVFHAAALKHVPLLEAHAAQAASTNVLGTMNVLSCAQAVGASRLVFISTDKAVRPSSVMGATKLIGEQLVLDTRLHISTCAVRFGNVLGSRGSVVPTFVSQIRAGGPVTVTDPRMTRYFMSIPEAVRLVLHAAALSRGGEIFMLDMGEPVRIMDLAKRMIQLSGRRPGADIEVRVTQTRPGEKLAEQLHTPEERPHATSHPSVVRLEPVSMSGPGLDQRVAAIEAAALRGDDDGVVDAIDAFINARSDATLASVSRTVAMTPSGLESERSLSWI